MLVLRKRDNWRCVCVCISCSISLHYLRNIRSRQTLARVMLVSLSYRFVLDRVLQKQNKITAQIYETLQTVIRAILTAFYRITRQRNVPINLEHCRNVCTAGCRVFLLKTWQYLDVSFRSRWLNICNIFLADYLVSLLLLPLITKARRCNEVAP